MTVPTVMKLLFWCVFDLDTYEPHPRPPPNQAPNVLTAELPS